jgi:integrase
LLKSCYKGALTIGINTNLKVSDLLRLKVGHVKDLKAGKVRRITLNKTCINAIQNLLSSKQYEDDDYLFQSQRRHVLTVPSVHKLVKGWCSEINLKGNYGSHTLRKTWGYHQRVTFGIDLPRLMVCFNHSTQRQTLDYLCIQPQEIKDVYENEL